MCPPTTRMRKLQSGTRQNHNWFLLGTVLYLLGLLSPQPSNCKSGSLPLLCNYSFIFGRERSWGWKGYHLFEKEGFLPLNILIISMQLVYWDNIKFVMIFFWNENKGLIYYLSWNIHLSSDSTVLVKISRCFNNKMICLFRLQFLSSLPYVILSAAETGIMMALS